MKDRIPVILIADSCSGGLGVLKHVLSWAGDFCIEYLADYEKNPFGLKSGQEIAAIVESWFHTLIGDSVCMVVIACNTASIAAKSEKQRLAREHGVPVTDMIEAFEACLRNNRVHVEGKTVAIMGTKYTIDSDEYSRSVANCHPKRLITIVATSSEREVAWGTYGSTEGKEKIKNELAGYKDEHIETVILACTCLESIEDQIKEALGADVCCLNPAVEMSYLVRQKLRIDKGALGAGIVVLNTSSSRESMQSIELACQTNLGQVPRIDYLRISR